jgi:hypothetical protein
MSDKKGKAHVRWVRFDMNRTGIFALCAMLSPQVAASYGVRLSAIPEAYWGTWVPAAQICEDADKSAIVFYYVGFRSVPGGSGRRSDLLLHNSARDTWVEQITNGAFAGWNQIGGSSTSYSVPITVGPPALT